MDNQDRQQNQMESKKSRRSLAKYNKEVPRYECFCSKQYLSYPALYLHLKNKHQSYFLYNKNNKKQETTKLIESFDSQDGFKVYKISPDTVPNMEKQKFDPSNLSVKNCQGQGLTDNSLYYSNNGFLPYGNFPYQFSYEYMINKEQSSPPNKDATIQNAFAMFFEGLNITNAKEKAQTELLLDLLIFCINENYTILKQYGEQMICRRYSFEQNCKYLSVFLSFFEKKWLPQTIKQENKFYSFYLQNASIIVQEKYKRILQELSKFLEIQRNQDISQPEIILSKLSLSQNLQKCRSEPPANEGISNSESKNKPQQSQSK